MKKTLFSSLLLLTSLLLTTFTASAQLLYTEGRDYEILETPIPLQNDKQKEVVEFFSFACPHCFNLEFAISKWAKESKPEDVGFYQIPATGGKQWNFLARVKYVADKLGLDEDFHSKYFSAIHKDKNRKLLGDKDTAIDMMTNFGASKETAEKAWDSLQVKSGLKRSADLWKNTGLSGVPVIVVNGKYKVQLTTTYDKLFEVIDFLLSTTDIDK